MGLGHGQGVERGHGAGHQIWPTGPAALGPQEAEVEAVDVVTHHHPARQPVGQIGMDGGEGGSPGQHLPRDAVDVGRARVTAGVDQGAEGSDLPARGVEHDHAHLDDPLVLGRETGGLHIDHRESGPFSPGEPTAPTVDRRCDRVAYAPSGPKGPP